MGQITGSGPGNGTNYVMVDNSVGSTPFGFPTGRLFTTGSDTSTQVYAGATGPMGLDKATNALNTIDYEHHEIHAGGHYFLCGSASRYEKRRKLYA